MKTRIIGEADRLEHMFRVPDICLPPKFEALLSTESSISGRLQHRRLLGHEKTDNQTEKTQD